MPGAILENVITQFPPPKVVPSETKRATRPTKKLPQFLIDDARISTKETFDPKKHLAYQPPAKVYTMADIGLEGHGIAPTAVSEPFPLFTEEAIKQMRAEVFSDEVMQHCQYMSGFTPNMVRGMGAERAPFTYDAWKSPELLARVSEVAGVELVPAVDFEIANVNISVSDTNKTVVAGKEPDGDDTSAFAWHYDSFPFVCVVMLSDCTGMVGGETALRMPTGEIRKARGPSMGTAVVMQGRYIEHQALKAFGGRERISMVTAFRTKSPFIRDETVLTGSRGISDLSQLYHQYSEYRLENLEERIRAKLKAERERHFVAKRPFDVKDMRSFLTEQRNYIDAMLDEIYEVED